MAKKKNESQMPRKYDLENEALSSTLYQDYKKWTKRDEMVRIYLEQDLRYGLRNQIRAGQMIMFNYLQPIHKDELEYYDGKPVTLFFNMITVPPKKDSQGKVISKGGKRVLGFNIHYYPPRLRRKILDRVLEIYRDVYEKFWNRNLTRDASGFDYEYLLKRLQKAKLDFGIRMYDPALMTRILPVPANKWFLVALTEGQFFKKTRAAILQFWRSFISKYG